MSIDVYADGLICCLSSWLEAGHCAERRLGKPAAEEE